MCSKTLVRLGELGDLVVELFILGLFGRVADYFFAQAVKSPGCLSQPALKPAK